VKSTGFLFAAFDQSDMILVYGAYGYTGELVAREAGERGLDFTVAGRNGTKTRGLGVELGVESRVFEADQARDSLDGVDVVLNCAGPFVETYEPIVQACLETGTHYADITGEFTVFEDLAERDREAEQAGVCLLPGAGFDVTPTDCLAGHLHERLPDATHLRLGFEAHTNVSGGTLASAIEHAGGGGKTRRDGRIEDVPLAADSRTIDFGAGPRNAITVPWGDISTAYYTTGVPNIDVYMAVPSHLEPLVRAGNYTAGLLEVGPVKGGLKTLARMFVDGPAEQTREREQVFVWGEAENGDETVTSRLVTPETYALTVDAATTAAARLDDPDAPTGYHTPASAFDPNFVLGLDGVEGFFDEAFPDLV
jgi:short subunit dehydrogenase-like uncharacterized protein